MNMECELCGTEAPPVADRTPTPKGSCGVDLAAPGRLTCASAFALDRRGWLSAPCREWGRPMRRRVMMVLAGVAVCCAPLVISGVADAGAASAVTGAVWTGGWGRAMEVPGSGALNKGGDAVVISVSCASAGNCAAGGFYTRRLRQRAGVRGERAARPVGQGDRGARLSCPEQGRVRKHHVGVVRLGGELRGGRVLHRRVR